MADITFECPECKQHLEIDARNAGVEIKCPTCFRPIVVPQAALTSIADRPGEADLRVKTSRTGAVFSTRRSRPQLLLIVAGVLLLTLAGARLLNFFNERNEKATERASQAQHEQEYARQRLQTQYLMDTNFPANERSIESREKDSDCDAVWTYSISFINANCLVIKRDVQFENIKGAYRDLLNQYSSTKQAIYALTDSDPLLPTLKKTQQELLFQLRPYNDWADAKRAKCTQFRVLRSANELGTWIGRYRENCKIAAQNKLVSGVQKELGKCCIGETEQFGKRMTQDSDFKPVTFVTPNILKVGSGEWSAKEVDVLEGLCAKAPELEADIQTVRERLANKRKEANDLIQEHKEEEEKARDLLK